MMISQKVVEKGEVVVLDSSISNTVCENFQGTPSKEVIILLIILLISLLIILLIMLHNNPKIVMTKTSTMMTEISEEAVVRCSKEGAGWYHLVQPHCGTVAACVRLL